VNVMLFSHLEFLVLIVPNIGQQLCIALDTVHFTFIEHYKVRRYKESHILYFAFFINQVSCKCVHFDVCRVHLLSLISQTNQCGEECVESEL
jgi:hypothetical protein